MLAIDTAPTFLMNQATPPAAFRSLLYGAFVVGILVPATNAPTATASGRSSPPTWPT